MTNQPAVRRHFVGELPAHTTLNPESETYARDKWKRGNEQRRLKAYLKGKVRFAHGRTPAMPIGFNPILWPVVPNASGVVKHDEPAVQ